MNVKKHKQFGKERELCDQLWMIVNDKWTWMIVKFLTNLYEWFVIKSEEWSMNESEEWSMSEEQFVNDKQFVNEKHLGVICAFSIRLIMFISWVIMFLHLLVPTNFKFKPIFLVFYVEVHAHLQ
jgi:hypothetical protein